MDNIQSEFQELKDELKKLNIEVFYKSDKIPEVRSVYVQRHNLDDLISRFKEAYS